MNRIALLSRLQSTAPDEGAAGIDSHRYWAFLSYSHADSRAADRLHRWLEHFRTPKSLIGGPHPLGIIPERLTPIFRDRHELAAASSLGREIDEALRDSRFLLVLCSPAAAKSRWVDEEVRAFKRINGEDRVLAAIVAGEPLSGDDDECFPPALRFRVGKDGRLTKQRVEPIAADLREDRDGWRTGALKIAAGILDVGLDDLIQRDQLRRQRRMTWIVAASILGMAFTTGLSVVAINARDAARDERREAEGLVGFMLGDLKAELEPIQRLDALDKVGARALAYYERQDKSGLSDEALAQRSKALTLLGQIATTRGDADGALKRYQEAMLGTGELVARYPDDASKLFDHAQNVFYVGELARRGGQLDRSEAAYRDYQRLAQAMLDIEPASPKYQMEMLYARENLGIVLAAQRRFDEALREFDATTAPMQLLANRFPSNKDYQSELGNALAWQADTQRDVGKLDLAIATRQRQIDLLRRLSDADPGNAQLRQRLLPAFQGLAQLLFDTGRPTLALDQLRTDIGEVTRLLAIEETNTLWQTNAIAARLEMIGPLLKMGRRRDAATQNGLACSAIAANRARDRANALLDTLATTCLANRARLALDSGDRPRALEFATAALQSAQSERSVDRVKDQLRVASSYLLLGDVQRASGDLGAARTSWEQGLRSIPANIALRPREIADQHALLRRLGRYTEARALNDRLNAIGYKQRS